MKSASGDVFELSMLEFTHERWQVFHDQMVESEGRRRIVAPRVTPFVGLGPKLDMVYLIATDGLDRSALSRTYRGGAPSALIGRWSKLEAKYKFKYSQRGESALYAGFASESGEAALAALEKAFPL
jgi:hypothetical protein